MAGRKKALDRDNTDKFDVGPSGRRDGADRTDAMNLARRQSLTRTVTDLVPEQLARKYSAPMAGDQPLHHDASLRHSDVIIIIT